MTLLHRRSPCAECPWRRDTPPGQFPVDRYAALRSTAPGPAGESVPMNTAMFACHKSSQGEPVACAGWLAVCGLDHVRVRLALLTGDIPECLVAGPHPDWPALFDSYEEMAEAQGR